MVTWIGTRLFYAILFFFLGAWATTVSPGMKDLVRQAEDAGHHSFEKLGAWTSSTLAPTADGQAEKPKEAASAPSLAPSTAPAPSPAASPAPAPATTAEAPIGQELLVNARTAYANHDILGAINAYRGYIDRNPGAIEARGELGNVYFGNGRPRDAAQAYFEAAMLKLKAGDVAGAQIFLDPVRQGDGALGDDLRREIAKAQTASK